MSEERRSLSEIFGPVVYSPIESMEAPKPEAFSEFQLRILSEIACGLGVPRKIFDESSVSFAIGRAIDRARKAPLRITSKS